jgi:hypothetical protein
MALISCALISGQVEENRELAWQRNKLQRDLDHIQDQVKTNDKFLKDLNTDPNLAERLAQLQMKMVRRGATVLDVKGQDTGAVGSPFRLVTIPPPPPVKPYEPGTDLLSRLFVHPQVRLLAYGLGAMAIAMSLILGGGVTPRKSPC